MSWCFIFCFSFSHDSTYSDVDDDVLGRARSPKPYRGRSRSLRYMQCFFSGRLLMDCVNNIYCELWSMFILCISVQREVKMKFRFWTNCIWSVFLRYTFFANIICTFILPHKNIEFSHARQKSLDYLYWFNRYYNCNFFLSG